MPSKTSFIFASFLLCQPVLAQLPIDIPTREGGDTGMPVALTPPEKNPVSAIFHELAAKVLAAVA